DHFGARQDVRREDIDQILREAPDRGRVAKQLMRIEVYAAVIPIAVIEMSVEQEHSGVTKIREGLLTNGCRSIHIDLLTSDFRLQTFHLAGVVDVDNPATDNRRRDAAPQGPAVERRVSGLRSHAR